ncbi:MaoC family dehydratase [Nitrobacteraceae bacterium UC4446_H13]
MNYVEKVFQSIAAGDGVCWTKTVTESDVGLFAGITGDLSPNHVNEEYMKSTAYGGRIAQGVLVLGLSSAAVWMFAAKFGVTGASLGYDKVRFVKPVMLGDTVTIDYRAAEFDPGRARIVSDVSGRNQRGEVVLSARHVLKVIADRSAA